MPCSKYRKFLSDVLGAFVLLSWTESSYKRYLPIAVANLENLIQYHFLCIGVSTGSPSTF